MMTGVQDSVRTSPARFYLMREIVNATQPDMQRRILDIKKYFFDIIQEKLDPATSVTADVNISRIPHILEGLKLP